MEDKVRKDGGREKGGGRGAALWDWSRLMKQWFIRPLVTIKHNIYPHRLWGSPSSPNTHTHTLPVCSLVQTAASPHLHLCNPSNRPPTPAFSPPAPPSLPLPPSALLWSALSLKEDKIMAAAPSQPPDSNKASTSSHTDGLPPHTKDEHTHTRTWTHSDGKMIGWLSAAFAGDDWSHTGISEVFHLQTAWREATRPIWLKIPVSLSLFRGIYVGRHSDEKRKRIRSLGGNWFIKSERKRKRKLINSLFLVWVCLNYRHASKNNINVSIFRTAAGLESEAKRPQCFKASNLLNQYTQILR